MAFKTLEDSFIYQMLNKDGLIHKNIAKILTSGTVLSKENVEEPFMIINKNFKFPLKYKIFQEIENGVINMVFSPDNAKVPTSMPFFLTKNSHGDVVAIVILDTYGTIDKDKKNVNIEPKKLYCMLEGAHFSLACYHFSQQIPTKTSVITNGSAIYANMFTRVLNKKYALNIDKNKLHKVLFIASKFYLINILGLQDNEMAFNYSIKNCPNGNHFILKEFNDLIPTIAFTDISTFISTLSKEETGLGFKDLTVRGYIESFINMYDGSALLSLESFPYFLYNVFAVTNGAYINNQYILEDIVDNNGAKIYTDLMNLV